MNIGDLKQRQGLPLELKIRKSISIIEKFYEQNDGDVYISRGGVDSVIVGWLAQQSIYKDKIENVTIASVEPSENIKFNKEQGVTLLKSGGTMNVIQDWGYPLISKDVSMKISRYQRSKHEWAKLRRLHGYMGDNGRWCYDSMIPKKYQFLIYAPFELSEKCCDKTKKKPLKEYEKVTNKKPITGEMASESLLREREYLKHGCIMNDKKRIKCTPIGFWTDQDIKECIIKYEIPYPKEIYGDIVEIDNKLMFTGEQRTGCTICGFGIMFDIERFDRLKNKKPFQYNYMIGGGQWVRKDLYRWVKFRPSSIPIWSNLYWIPNNKGYGYKLPLNYIFEGLKLNKSFDIIK